MRSCADIQDVPCVTLSDTSELSAFKTAIQSVPRDGGVLVIQPGTYDVTPSGVPWLAERAWMRIVGVPDNTGRRPHLRGVRDPVSGHGPNAIIPWGGTNGDLNVENLEITGAGNCIYAASQIRSQKITLRNLDVHHCMGHLVMIGWEKPGEEDDEILIENSTFSHVGQNHNVYIDRIAKATLRNITSHSPGTLHALKCIAKECNIVDSKFSNARLDGKVDNFPAGSATHWTKLNPAAPYLGTAPLSLIACQKGIVTGNEIVWVFDKNGRLYGSYGTGPTPVIRQPRHDIDGCDDPDGYVDGVDSWGKPDKIPILSSPFWTANFWGRVEAAGLTLPKAASNPY